jgi:hypothetical protein
MACPFYFSLLLSDLGGLFLLKIPDGGETHVPKAEVSFLSSLVSSSYAAQGAAENLWPSGLPPPAKAQG